MGKNNGGIFGVARYNSELFTPRLAHDSTDDNLIPASDLLVKLLPNNRIDRTAIAEVKALKCVGQLVASGMLEVEYILYPQPDAGLGEEADMAERLPPLDPMSLDAYLLPPSPSPSHSLPPPPLESFSTTRPAIIMRKMPGSILTETEGWKEATMSMLRSRSRSNTAGEDSDVEPEEMGREESDAHGGASIRKQMMLDTLQLMCDKVSEFAVEFRFLHRLVF